jgi:hypothetical protein
MIFYYCIKEMCWRKIIIMNDPKDDLLYEIKKSKEIGDSLINKAKGLETEAHFIKDLAEASEWAVTYVSSANNANLDFNSQIQSYRKQNRRLEKLNANISLPDIFAVSSSANAVASTMVTFADPTQLANLATPKQEEAQKAAINLGQVIDRLAEKPNVLELLNKFGLSNNQEGLKSPCELFAIACAAFETPLTPSNPISTSLIPMRECMNSTLAILLRRRPTQEKAGSHKDKIISICKQAAYSSIEYSDIENIAERWEVLSDKLSRSKQGDISRAEWRAIMRKAMLLLIGLLKILDQTKMR